MNSMTLARRPFLALAGLVLLGGPILLAQANDDIFPPAASARPVIDFDGRGFLIRGQRQFIASGSIHFPRVPRELWRDRLLKLKRAGFNTVETYVFWNFHEPRKGQFDFSGNKDLGAFLRTAQDVGLYAIVRVGPYVCAEWDSGGFPVWLRSEPGMKVRGDAPAYLAAVDRYFDRILPIVAAHQVHRGGNVILVQLENEHPMGWGTEMPNDYFTHLRDRAQAAGIEVPYFFSGLNHGGDPGGDQSWDSRGRKSPWLSTETWIRWYDKYGEGTEAEVRQAGRVLWNIIAHGGNGFNIYMFHGGTNFDFSNDNEVAASYDYGTLLGQAGDLRASYYRAKRVALLATSLPGVFADGEDATGAFADMAQGVAVRARKGPAGTVVFLEADPKDPHPKARLKDGPTLALEPSETVPLLRDVAVMPGVKVRAVGPRTLAVASHGRTATWVVYAPAGEEGRLELSLDAQGKVLPGAVGLGVEAAGQHVTVRTASSEEGPRQCLIETDNRLLRVLVMTPGWADRTWVIGEPGSQDVVAGPEYVGDFSDRDGRLEMTVVRPYGHPAPATVLVYGQEKEAGLQAVTGQATAGKATVESASVPALSAWEVSRADAPWATAFDDTTWVNSEGPPPLGADGEPGAYGWYRAGFEAPVAGKGELRFAGVADNAVVFLNGQRVGTLKADSRAAGGSKETPLTLSAMVRAGRNVLAVFVSHGGRDKGYRYLGPLAELDPKGMVGPVSVGMSGNSVAVTGWKLRGGVGEPEAASLKWEAAAGDEAAPAFWRAHFVAPRPGEAGPRPVYRVTFAGLSRGSVWLNGHNLGRYPEKIRGLDSLYLPECWLNDSGNTLVIFDEEGRSPGKVRLVREAEASREVVRFGTPARVGRP